MKRKRERRKKKKRTIGISLLPLLPTTGHHTGGLLPLLLLPLLLLPLLLPLLLLPLLPLLLPLFVPDTGPMP